MLNNFCFIKKENDLHYILLVICIIITCFWGLTSTYRFKLNSTKIYPSMESMEKDIVIKIENNPDFFVDPLKNNQENGAQVSKSSLRYASKPEDLTLGILGLDKSWVYHNTLSATMGSGKVFIVFIGLLMAVQGIAWKGERKADILRFFAGGTMLFILTLAGSMILGWVYYYSVITSNPASLIVSKIIQEKGTWKPDFSYQVVASFTSWFYWMTYALIGYFWGSITKNVVASLLAAPLLNFGWNFLLLYPVTPLYFLHRIIGKFMVLNEGSMFYLPPFKNINILLYLLSMLIFMGLSIFFQRMRKRAEKR